MAPRLNEILYPTFLQASKFAQDEYWIFLIQDLAYGNTPYGSFIDPEQSMVCSMVKGKRIYYIFDKLAAEKLFEATYDFFHEKLGFRSSFEYTQQNIKLRQMYTTQYGSWVDIKKKYIRELLLQNYTIDLKNKYGLSNHQMKLLWSCVTSWLQFGLLTKLDIQYDPVSCRILSIKDLFIDKKGHIRLNRDIEKILD